MTAAEGSQAMAAKERLRPQDIDDAITFVSEKSNDRNIRRNEENENRAITNQVF